MGSGHGWLIKGVQKYEDICQKLMTQKDFIVNCLFECNQITEQTLRLTDLLNMDKTENLENQNLSEIDINDILASGTLESV